MGKYLSYVMALTPREQRGTGVVSYLAVPAVLKPLASLAWRPVSSEVGVATNKSLAGNQRDLLLIPQVGPENWGTISGCG